MLQLQTVARRALSLALVAATIALGPLTNTARAEIVTTQTAFAARDAEAARARVGALLARDEVRRQFRAVGVEPAEAAARIASLTDAEIAALDARIEELPAGKDFLVLVASILVLTVLILLITDLFGWTDVFSFVNPLPRGDARSDRRR